MGNDQLENKTEKLKLSDTQVFNGIEYQKIQGPLYEMNLIPSCDQSFFVIHHCLAGRLKIRTGSRMIWLLPKDTLITTVSSCTVSCEFPLRDYEGASILYNKKIAPDRLSDIFSGIDVSLSQLEKKFTREEKFFVIRQDETVSQLFEQMWNGSEGMVKLKILELFLTLKEKRMQQKNNHLVLASALQTKLAREAAAYLAANMDRHVSLQELSGQFHISVTHLQNTFLAVFGLPVASYARMLKMQSAALRLEHTDQAILNIANDFGYSNAGKFSAAFMRVMGCTPSEWRARSGRKSDKKQLLGA